MADDISPIRGRGAAANPPNRFELIHFQPDPEADPADSPAPATQFLKDTARSLITYNDSPDVGFDASINAYRGCEHGCIYCYARPTHEYLGFSAGLDFESKILVKEDAPELLRRELASPRWQPQPLGMSGVTDPYQPIERRLELTRRCLQVLAEFRNPVVVITKNHLVTRDQDLLADLARDQAAAVIVSVTTLDGELGRQLEPRATQPFGRLAAIKELAKAGVPVGTLIAPVIPGLTDHELPSIVAAVAAAGVSFVGYTMLRLPYAVAPLFEQWLERHAPEKKERVLGRIRSVRGGKLNESRFGVRMRGEGVLAEQIHALFSVACKKAGLEGRRLNLSTAAFRRPQGMQRSLFDSQGT
jgi:DNA repair photolyase